MTLTPDQPKKLFLLDAYALIFRAYFAFSRNPLINSKGMNTSAVMGFTNTLMDLLNREKPTHIAVAFDTKATTVREDEFSAYKANRQETPEDLIISVPYIRDIIEAFNIPIVEKDGYEADDVIGTLAKQAEKEGYTVYMVTPDKDFAQLVSENIFMYKPSSGGKEISIMGIPEVLEKWEIERVDQVIDILGLWGDAVDNIPGVPGVGEKTAKKLVAEYGGMEGLMEHADEIGGKLGEKIRANKEQGFLSKRLATIILDVDVQFDETKYIREAPDKKKLVELFSELEFRTLGKKILGDDFNVNTSGGQIDLFSPVSDNEVEKGLSEENTDQDYQALESEADINAFVKLCRSKNKVSITAITDTDEPHQSILKALAISFDEASARVIEMDESLSRLQLLKELLEDEKLTKVSYNIKFLVMLLRRHNIVLKGKLNDPMLAHYLVEPEMKHDRERLTESYLGYTLRSMDKVLLEASLKKTEINKLTVSQLLSYAAERSDMDLRMDTKLEKELVKVEEQSLYEDIEMPLVRTLAAMEAEGVGLDVNFLEVYSDELGSDIASLEQKIYSDAGQEFNIASPKQLGEILFDKLEIPYIGKKTKSGQYSTNEEVLSALAEDHPMVNHVLDLRELSKLKSTYVDALPKLINPNTNRIHTSFNQAVAATGRLSSADPNLQNIPIRTERGKRIRKAFIPRGEEFSIFSADYSQVELRIVASISEDESLIHDFNAGLDIHAATASRVFGVSLDDVSSEMRRKAKMVNFGIIYGISAFGLAQRLGIPRKEAQQLKDEYFAKYPGVHKWMNDSIEIARKQGFVTTVMGRRRYLRDINSRNFTVKSFAERNAINAPVQGSAADMIKIAMNQVYDKMCKLKMKSKMTLQVHDELVFDVHHSELEQLQALVLDKMKNAMSLKVPVELDFGTGANWLEAH